ncbi:MAG: tetratricopeptide repeat protein, partial [Candidatus Margulisiibacteriota bacterium]
YVKLGRIDEAILVLEKSLAAGVKDVNLSETLAVAYLEKGKVAEAIKFYEDIHTQKPSDKSILRILGELYTKIEDYSRAANCYREMFSDDPEVSQEAIQRLEGLLKKVEGSIEIREILSEIYMRILNPESAVEKLTEILRLEPSKLEEVIGKLKAILRSYPNLPSAVLALAEAYCRQKNFSEAAESYFQLIKVKPEFIGQAMLGYQQILEDCPEQVLARSYLVEALLMEKKFPEALFEMGKIVEQDSTSADNVIRKCREILRSNPKILHAHVVLGQAYLAKGDYQRAAMEAEGVIALDSKVVAAHLLLGQAYLELNLLRKAVETFRRALTLDPYNLQIIERYREVKLKELEEEIESVKQRLQEDQWKLSLHIDLAKLYLKKQDPSAAIRQLQVAQKDPSREVVVCHLLGKIYRSQGRYDLAADQFSHALEKLSSETADLEKSIRADLGTTYEAMGEVKKAIKAYEAVLQLDVDYGNLAEKVKKLKTVSLSSMRNQALLAAISELGKNEIVSLWGWEVRGVRRVGEKEEVNISFGQEHNRAGFDFVMKAMFQAAEEEFSLAIQLDRRFATALNNYAVSLIYAHKFEEAKLKLLEATEVNPASCVFYNNLGVVYLFLGKIEQAKVALEKSYALNPCLSAVCLNLGDLYFCQGDLPKAYEFYRKVGNFDPLADLVEQRLLYRVP